MGTRPVQITSECDNLKCWKKPKPVKRNQVSTKLKSFLMVVTNSKWVSSLPHNLKNTMSEFNNGPMNFVNFPNKRIRHRQKSFSNGKIKLNNTTTPSDSIAKTSSDVRNFKTQELDAVELDSAVAVACIVKLKNRVAHLFVGEESKKHIFVASMATKNQFGTFNSHFLLISTTEESNETKIET